jgi:hypothetical protein
LAIDFTAKRINEMKGDGRNFAYSVTLRAIVLVTVRLNYPYQRLKITYIPMRAKRRQYRFSK